MGINSPGSIQTALSRANVTLSTETMPSYCLQDELGPKGSILSAEELPLMLFLLGQVGAPYSGRARF